MRGALLAAVMLALAAPASACSLAYSEFGAIGISSGTVVSERGISVVTIDLATGRESELRDDYMARFQVTDDGEWLLLRAQVGLGADCSGDEYFEVLDADTLEVVDTLEPGVNFDSAGTQLIQAMDRDAGTWNRLELGLWNTHTRHTVSAEVATYHFAAHPTEARVAAPNEDRTGLFVVDLDGPTAALSGWSDHEYVDEVHPEFSFDGDRLLAYVTGWDPAAPGDPDEWAGIWLWTDPFDGAPRHWELDRDLDRYTWSDMPVAATDLGFAVAHEDRVWLIASDGSARYVTLPAGMLASAVAKDGRGAIVAVTEDRDGDPEAAAVLRIDAAGRPSEWYRPVVDGLWMQQEVPSSVQTVSGPDGVVGEGAPPEENPMPFPPTLVLVGVLLALAWMGRTRQQG